MLKINLLNNAGIQSDKSEKKSGITNPFQVQPSEQKVKKSPVNDKNKQRIKEIEKKLDQTQATSKSKKNKKVNFFLPILLIIIFGIIGSGGYYLYSNPSIIKRVRNKITTLIDKRNEISKAIPVGENLLLNEDDSNQKIVQKQVIVTSEVSNLISKNTLELNLFTGILELIPNDATLIDLNITNDNLSLICIVNDIISGENIKFFVHNHKLQLKPELFYIEKTEDSNNYQITSLVKVIKGSDKDIEYSYQNDQQLSNSLNQIAYSFGIDMKPLTISKRDQSIIRDAHIILSGSKDQLLNFIRKLDIENFNIAIKNIEFFDLDKNTTMNKLNLKLDIIIYPRNF